MLDGLKTRLRDFLPPRCQVPAKYWYGRLRSGLEPEMRLLEALVVRGDRAVDVGGNRGVYAYRLWRLGARVEVFEPNPACLAVLGAWAAGKPAVRVHAVALSSRAGSADLHIPVDAGGTEHDASASIEHGGGDRARDVAVPLRTLDSFRFTDVRLVKIDVEGHEGDVIAGATETLSSARPALLVEIEQRHNSRPIAEVFRKVLDFGYRGFFLGPGGLTGLSAFDPGRHQPLEAFGASDGRLYINNFLFLHARRLAAGEYPGLGGARLLG